MSTKLKQPCARPGCPELVKIGKRYCDKHSKSSQQMQDRYRGSSTSRGYDSDWRNARDWHIGEHPLCAECERQGIVKAGEHVDHIIPFRGIEDPLRLDADNLQTLCRECHSRKTAREDGGFGGNKGNVIVICGSPGSGKSTYVENNMKDGDIRIDLDYIFQALSGLPLFHKPKNNYCKSSMFSIVMKVYDVLLSELEKNRNVRAWIITSQTNRQKREELKNRFNAKVIVLETPKEECIYRLKNDMRRDDGTDWQEVIEKWWLMYEPNEDEFHLCM